MRSRTNGKEARPLSVHEALRTALARNTRTAYRKGFRRFEDWCEAQGVAAMNASPAEVADFLVAVASDGGPERPLPEAVGPAAPAGEAGANGGREKAAGAGPLATATIRVIVAAIRRAYEEEGRTPPTADPLVAGVLRGISRLSSRRPRQVRALRAGEIRRLLARLDEEAVEPMRRTIAIRDAAVIAVGFAAALRRSEICGLEIGDVEFHGGPGGEAAGMVLNIRRSKTDQYGKGERIAVPEGELIRPVSRLLAWLGRSRLVGGEAAGAGAAGRAEDCRRRGPLFQTLRRGGHLQGRPMHPGDIGRLVKRRVRAIGLDPAEYSGHSLRAGFVTSAAECGARVDKIMEVTRHASPAMVLRYIRQADAFRDHAGGDFL